MEDLGTLKLLFYYMVFFFGPLVFVHNLLFRIERHNRRTADALEKIAKSLEAKPLKLDDVIGLDQSL